MVCSLIMPHRMLLKRHAVTSMPNLLPPYHRSLQAQVEIVDSLRSHSLSYEESRGLVAKWVSQPHLEADSWVTEWEDICEVEIGRWNAR